MLDPKTMEIILAGLFATPILFFFFGMVSVIVKSDIAVPPAMSTGLAMFLLASIGLVGGRKAVIALGEHPDLVWVILITAIICILLGPIFSFFAGNVFKKVAGLSTADSWATAGHYAAVGSATLAIGVSMAEAGQALAPGELIFTGWMSAMYPFLDSPSLISAIIFGRMALAKEGIGTGKVDTGKILHSSIFGMAVWLLGASLIIGMLSEHFSPDEMRRSVAFFGGMFRGVLSLFLIDMGIAAGKQLGVLKQLGAKLGIAALIAFTLPQIFGVIGILCMYVLHTTFPGLIGWGDALVFASITGSASFISAPAAMRAAIPEANPSVYLPLSVALTFPFNVILGLPGWQMLCMFLWGAM